MLKENLKQKTSQIIELKYWVESVDALTRFWKFLRMLKLFMRQQNLNVIHATKGLESVMMLISTLKISGRCITTVKVELV